MNPSQKHHPKIFNKNEVASIIDGRKTMFREVVKPQPSSNLAIIYHTTKGVEGLWLHDLDKQKTFNEKSAFKIPHQIGDIIYVKETWNDLLFRYAYKADDKQRDTHVSWKSPVLMPKCASRLFLQIVSLKVERLNSIGEEDAIKEGIEYEVADQTILYKDYLKDDCFQNWGESWDNCSEHPEKASFQSLWTSIHGKDSFDDKWIFAYEFKVVEKPVNF